MRHMIAGMIDTTIPEINVSELMEKVRAKAREIRKAAARGSGSFAALQPKELPALGLVPLAPSLILPKPPPARKERILELLARARETTTVGHWIPRPVRGFFRKQGGYNSALLEGVTVLAKANAELTSRIEQLTACLDVQHQWLSQQSLANHNWMEAASRFLGSITNQFQLFREETREQLDLTGSTLAEGLAGSRQKHETIQTAVRNLGAQSSRDSARVDEVNQQIRELQQESEALAKDLATLKEEAERRAAAGTAVQVQVDELWSGFNKLRGDGERMGEHLSGLQKESERYSNVEGMFQSRLDELSNGFQKLRGDGERMGEHLSNLQTESDRSASIRDAAGSTLNNLQSALTRAEEHLRNLQAVHDRNAGELERVALGAIELQRTLTTMDERQVGDGAYFRLELSQQASLLRRWLARDGSKKQEKLAVSSRKSREETPSRLDAFYVSFEDRFRGPRPEIKKRVEVYLPLIKKAGAGQAKTPVLDVGCGRGEWLELLRDKKLKASGVDINSAMLAQCRERNLKVVQADAVSHLRSLPDRSLGAVTGFHIIEHLELDILMDLLAETARVLVPGGLAIFESPNCKNLVVGATNFNIDPTHRNPVFPETAQFMLTIHGFQNVVLKYLAPVEAPRLPGKNRQATVLNELLYGPQDFAVIGEKPLKL